MSWPPLAVEAVGMAEEVVYFASAVAAVITAGFLVRKVWREVLAAVSRQDRINKLLERELGDDGNGSLKNRVMAMQGQLREAKTDVQRVQTTLEAHIWDAAVHVRQHDKDPHAHKHDDGMPDDGCAGPKPGGS